MWRDRLRQVDPAAKGSCLSWEAACFGRIGHTQPRRIAARSLARGSPANSGEETGDRWYKVRFRDRRRRDAVVDDRRYPAAEICSDRDLTEYDTLIIDEVHERNLNIDFLGHLHRLLQRRPDLRLIITSATIDPGRFAAFWRCAGDRGSGRTFRSTCYRPPTREAGESATSRCNRRSSTRSTSFAAWTAAATSWFSCPANARDPRRLPRRCAQAQDAAQRGDPAVRAPQPVGAGARLPEQATPHRAVDQRGRDLA